MDQWAIGLLALVWITLAMWVILTLAAIRREVERVKAAGAARGEAIRVIQEEVEAIQVLVGAMEAAMAVAAAEVVAEAEAEASLANRDMATASMIETGGMATTSATTTLTTQDEGAAATDATGTGTGVGSRIGKKMGEGA